MDFVSESRLPRIERADAESVRKLNGPMAEVEALKRFVGRHIVPPPDWGVALFPVRVEKDGGSDGTNDTPASWTYTVRDMVKELILGEGVGVVRPRPAGHASYPTDPNAVGLGFVECDGALKLWDVGEIYGQAEFDARISGTPTRDGTKCRWTYPFVEVEKTIAGYGGWTDKSGGLTGTGRHTSEDQNNTTGTMGNGVVLPDATATVDLVAVPVGTRVRMRVVKFLASGDPTTEYWFESPTNGVSVECP